MQQILAPLAAVLEQVAGLLAATCQQLLAFLATAASVWQVAFLPFYFFKVMGLGVLSAALLSSLVSAAGAAGKLSLGRASDRWRRNRLLATASGAVVLAYLVFFTSSNLAAALAAALCMGFLSSAIFPVMQALVADSCRGVEGTAMGLTTTTQSVATVIAPNIAALMFTLGVGRAIALVATVPAVAMLLVALLLREPRGSDVPRS